MYSWNEDVSERLSDLCMRLFSSAAMAFNISSSPASLATKRVLTQSSVGRFTPAL